MFQHTAARRRLPVDISAVSCYLTVSTHSRAEAAAAIHNRFYPLIIVSTHSRAEAAAMAYCPHDTKLLKFQHTAARRRLPLLILFQIWLSAVSTHSRAEAAAAILGIVKSNKPCFNTQPRGGGC